MRTIIFLGGCPGVGKTTLAYKLALKYHIDKVVSLDILKSILKLSPIRLNQYIYTTTHEAYRIENLTIIDGYKKHSDIINKYFADMIKSLSKDKVIIVEGVSVNNDFIKYFYDTNNIYINLYVKNIDILKERFAFKNKMRKGKWLDDINEILEINEFLKNNSKINIEVNGNDDVIDEIGEYIDESIFL